MNVVIKFSERGWGRWFVVAVVAIDLRHGDKI